MPADRVSDLSVAQPKGEIPGWAAYATLAAILAVASWLRFPTLGQDSLWLDEAASWTQAQGSVLDIIRATAQDNYPPLHNLILAASIRLLGDSEWALRLSSAIFGVLNVAAIYWVGTLFAGRVAGLIAALFLALSGYHVWYSQEARTYALLALCATLFAGASIRLTTKPTTLGTAAVMLSGIALLYTHPFGALTWVAIAIATAGFIAWRPQPEGPRLVSWAAMQAGVLLAFLPWAWVLFTRAVVIHDHGFWIPYPTSDFVLSELTGVFSGTWLLAFVSLAAVIAISRPTGESAAIGRGGPPAAFDGLDFRPPAVAAIILAWALVPGLIGYAISLLTTPIFLGRYVIASLPAVLILAGAGVARFATGRVALALVVLVSIGVAWPGRTPWPREDWRGAAAAFAKATRPGDCVAIFGDNGFAALHYYYRQPVDCVRYTAAPAGVHPDEIPSNRVLMILYSSGGRDVLKRFETPAWRVASEVPFRGVNLVELIRATP